MRLESLLSELHTSLLSFLTSSSASSARATNWATEMETTQINQKKKKKKRLYLNVKTMYSHTKKNVCHLYL